MRVRVRVRVKVRVRGSGLGLGSEKECAASHLARSTPRARCVGARVRAARAARAAPTSARGRMRVKSVRYLVGARARLRLRA